jgi:glucose/arabinose dehydrogenase
MSQCRNPNYRRLLVASLVVAAFLLTLPAPPGIHAQEGSPPALDFELVADGFTSPVHFVDAADGSGRFFVVEQGGTIRVVTAGEVQEEPFLDITDSVSGANEQGLLSMALHPDFADNGLFFIDYTDTEGDTQVVRYSVSDDDPNVADMDSATTILTVDQPASNHNGGLLLFGPDGYLYVGLGDGGGGNSWNGQDLGGVLGSILRIDVNSKTEPYVIPPDNPFVDDPSAAPEIWAYGLRNPWRFSFDRDTGDLWLGDVGSASFEEIDHQPAATGGLNFGWDLMEGPECHQTDECGRDDLVLPVFAYDRNFGCSVIGGYVYRGQKLDQLVGRYLFGDYCSGYIWVLSPAENGEYVASEPLESGLSITSFAEDSSGELYVVDRAGGIYRIVG